MARPRTSRPKGETCGKCGFDDWTPSGACAVCGRRKFLSWAHANPAKRLLTSAKHRAKRAGVPFNLTLDEIQIPTHCPATGIPLVLGGDAAGNHVWGNPSLDRLRPELGYTKGNVVVVSHLANTIKSNAGSEQVLAVGKWLQSLGL